jgi:tripartite-type tricarboxylate transporter receptor subunit TctC
MKFKTQRLTTSALLLLGMSGLAYGQNTGQNAGQSTAQNAGLSSAQAAWPNKPVKIVVPSGAGSAPDIMARELGAELQKRLGQPFLAENRAGAGGSLGSDLVAKASPDGYTFVMGNIGSHAMNIATYKNLPYNPIKDFAPVVLVSTTASLFSVSKDLPVKNIAEFLSYAKREGDKVTFASGGIGSSSHLAGEYLNVLAGLKMRHVPYKDVQQALTDVSTGQVTLMMSNMPPAMSHIKSGRNKPLAVTTPKRTLALPDVPTMGEAGVPGFEQIVWFGLFGPAGTPAAIVDRLNAEVNSILKSAEFRDKLSKTGSEAGGGSPKEFTGFVATEMVKWVRIGREARITPE